MMRQHWTDSALFGFVKPAATVKAFHKVQPRPRAHVVASSGNATRKTSRLESLKRPRSQAGSPMFSCPKSIMEDSSPGCPSSSPSASYNPLRIMKLHRNDNIRMQAMMHRAMMCNLFNLSLLFIR